MQMYNVILQNKFNLNTVMGFYTTTNGLQPAISIILQNFPHLANKNMEILVKPASDNPAWWENQLFAQAQELFAQKSLQATFIKDGYYYTVTQVSVQEGFTTWDCGVHDNCYTPRHTTFTILLPTN